MSSSPELPLDYLGWRSGLADDALVLFDGCEWTLASLDELEAPVRIDGCTTTYLERAKVYVRTIVESTGETSTVDADGNEIPFSRVAGFLTIGSDNVEWLCVDPSEGYSVWAFLPGEGGLVERLADSLKEWTDQAEVL